MFDGSAERHYLIKWMAMLIRDAGWSKGSRT